MLKNVSKLEFELAGKLYHFFCDSDAPLEHIKESLFQFVNFVGKVQEQIKALESIPKPNLPNDVKSEVVPEVKPEVKKE